ncbi:hypothetical protein EDF68_10167 [Ochrobactrum sp. BH3]|nr:hypothetical protein EDF68_10167 [Ochrobactrum sp. BH3]
MSRAMGFTFGRGLVYTELLSTIEVFPISGNIF